MYMNLESFERSRMSHLLDGFLLVGKGIKYLSRKYMEARQRKADKIVNFYIKDHGDLERLQREMLTQRSKIESYLL